MTARRWLVSSAGRRGHLVRILRSSGTTGHGFVLAVDASPLSAAGMLSDAFEIVPRATDPNFVDVVLSLCERNAITDVVPTIDPELPVYADAVSRFADAGVRVWVSGPDTVTLGTDKWLFHRWLRDNGLSGPDTWEVRDPAVTEVDGPMVIKPRSGSSSVGLLKAPSLASVDLGVLTDDFIVQRCVSGFEVTADFAVDQFGRLRGVGLRRRLEVRAGEVSKAQTIRHDRVLAEIERFVDSLPSPFGVLNVQVFVDDATDSVQFIEMNPRFGGGYPLTWEAGGRFPAWLDASEPARQDARAGLVMLRYDDAVFAEIDAVERMTR